MQTRVSTSFLFVAERSSVVWLHHSLFTRSLDDGHLGCLHSLGVVNNAAVNAHSLCGGVFSGLSGPYQGMEFLGHTVTLHSEDLSSCFPK